MKGIDKYVSIFIFLGPRGGVGSSNTKIQRQACRILKERS
jgi:hypothetical protein